MAMPPANQDPNIWKLVYDNWIYPVAAGFGVGLARLFFIARNRGASPQSSERSFARRLEKHDELFEEIYRSKLDKEAFMAHVKDNERAIDRIDQNMRDVGLKVDSMRSELSQSMQEMTKALYETTERRAHHREEGDGH